MDTAWHQSFSGTANAVRAVVKHHDKLDLDGCLVRFTSQPTERGNGCGQVCKKQGGMALCFEVSQPDCDVFIWSLTTGRLMGVSSWPVSPLVHLTDGGLLSTKFQPSAFGYFIRSNVTIREFCDRRKWTSSSRLGCASLADRVYAAVLGID
jgi:hypothetical protein